MPQVEPLLSEALPASSAPHDVLTDALALDAEGATGVAVTPASALPRIRARDAPYHRAALAGLAFAPFRTFFLAGLVFDTAGFVFGAALGWLVLEMTGSAASVGFVSFVYSLPFALFTLHAGLLTDRVGARMAFAVSLAGSGLATLLLGVLVLGDLSPFPVVVIVAFGIGVLAVIGSPASISIVNDLVPPAAVPSGISLIFLALNIGRIVGGLIGGLMLIWLSSGWTILISGLLLCISAVPIWRLPTPGPQAGTSSGVASVRPLLDAGRYAARSPVLGVVMLLAVFPGMLGLSYAYLLPVAAVELGLEADGMGALLAFAGIGGLIASLTATPLMRAVGHGRTIFIGLGAVSFGLVTFGLASSLPIVALTMILTGSGFVLYASASLSVIQALSPPAFRGRLTALFALLYWGLMPFGALLGGAAAGAVGARTALAVAGTIVLVSGVCAHLGRREIARLRIGPDGRAIDV